MRSARSVLSAFVVFVAVVAGTGVGSGVASAAGVDSVRLVVLSNRADLVSGGDALVRVLLPAGVSARGVRLSLGGRDVTSMFARRADGYVEGVLSGMSVGVNVLTARLADGSGARLTITNHSLGGPVFSGPQVQPVVCETQGAALGPAKDAQCNADPVVSYQYKNSVTGQFAAYDPKSPPQDVATTTTDQGNTVPYIVRVETGAINRGIYQIAALADPARPWKPWQRQQGWNGKLVYRFGGGCAPDHRQGTATDLMAPMGRAGNIGNTDVDVQLKRGFAVAASTNTILGQQCNTTVSAETMMMIKERLQETLGPVRYTIGDGCSGGSMQQNSIADNYVGLLDGIRPTCSFPDVWAELTRNDIDCNLLLNYFTTKSPQLWASPEQQAAVEGQFSTALCSEVRELFTDTLWQAAGAGCGFTAEEKARFEYDPATNPRGTRCTMSDYYVSQLGRRPDGKANRPLDNEGVQYGLAALNAGTILPEQFVDLNEKIGGWDIDGNYQPQRTVADRAALRRMYRNNILTYGRGLAKVPSIDARTDNNPEAHQNSMPLVTRARMVRSNGNSASQVLWFEAEPGAFGMPTPARAEESFVVMDKWLAAMERDTSGAPLEDKVLRHKPKEAVDACWIAQQRTTDQATCDAVHTSYGVARNVAGEPQTTDVLKCQLQPLDRGSYKVAFSDAQWARLRQTFRTGVCDYSKPGVEQQPPAGYWLTYAYGPDGRPLGAPPVSTRLVPGGSRAPGSLPSSRGHLAATGMSTLLPSLAALWLTAGLYVTRRRRTTL
jgi:hypothetical protein